MTKQEPRFIPIKSKRPGRTHRRRQHRRYRNKNADLIHRSASIIQKGFREFLSVRYKKTCPNNYNDTDYIDFEKVSSIPRTLLVPINGTGYNALSLLGWFCCKQVDPITRKPLDDAVPLECAAKILRFMKEDRTFKKRRGHFKTRKEFLKVLQSNKTLTLT